ncbi:MAG: hypothetical protein J5I47_08510 [Vicingus serpentipes]|nr:hypothetical protein [Vicingus serpentipes]
MTSSFLLVLFIPFVGEKETESFLEKRALAEFPKWRWNNVWTFFFGYQEYFDDRFTFRNDIIDFYGNLKYEKLKTKPLSNKAVIGKEGWLFITGKDYLNNISVPFTKEELQILHYNLVVTTEWFNKKGVKYYLTIPPVKPRIYSEYLPDYMKVRIHFSRLEQLNNYLNERKKINIIDYRDELIKRKTQQQIYYKTDTHWNEYGAFVGYTKIINEIIKDFKQITPLELKDYKETKTDGLPGDLIGMLGYNSTMSSTLYNLVRIDSLIPILTYSSDPKQHTGKIEEWKMPNSNNGLSIFVVRDSYSEHLRKFLSSHFDKSTYVWTTDLPIQKIAKSKPDIVLHELIERYIHFYLKLPPEIKNDTTFLSNYNIEDY